MKLTKSFATLNLNELTHDELLNVLETAVNGAKLQIQQFAQRPDFSDKMSLVFGTSPAGLQGAWADGLVTVPEIEIVSRREIDGANGAFAAATDSIYLAKEFLTENINQPDAIVQVVLEELGHYVDDLINHGADTPGDEGAKFSAFVLGENLSASELAQLDNENDKAKVILGGQVVEIEKAELAVVVNSLGDIGARDNPNTQNVDESSDGIFGDYETGEITLRAALEEASNLGKSIDITFGVTGTINLLDSSISIPDGSSIIASSKEDGSPQVKINGDYSGLIVGSNTSIKNLAIIVQNSIAIDVLGSNNQIDSNISYWQQNW
jgi:hypothetical protein